MSRTYAGHQSEWLSSDKLGYELKGGREGGYRGYTLKKNILSTDFFN